MMGFMFLIYFVLHETLKHLTLIVKQCTRALPSLGLDSRLFQCDCPTNSGYSADSAYRLWRFCGSEQRDAKEQLKCIVYVSVSCAAQFWRDPQFCFYWQAMDELSINGIRLEHFPNSFKYHAVNTQSLQLHPNSHHVWVWLVANLSAPVPNMSAFLVAINLKHCTDS